MGAAGITKGSTGISPMAEGAGASEGATAEGAGASEGATAEGAGASEGGDLAGTTAGEVSGCTSLLGSAGLSAALGAWGCVGGGRTELLDLHSARAGAREGR